MKFNTLLFIGPQGSGKGTQAKKLAERLGFFYWEMGGILRSMHQEDSDLGRKLKELMDQGVLLNDDLLLEVVQLKIDQIPQDKGIIFDGIPRRIGQAEFLINYLNEQNRKPIATIFIDIPHEESLNRLLLRAQTEGRKDDTKEAIEFRLEQYRNDTLPVLDYLKQQTEFLAIDGRPPVDEVTVSLNAALEI